VQVVLLLQAALQSTVGIVPRAKVRELAADLLGLDAGVVREQREVGAGLVGLLFSVGRIAGIAWIVERLVDVYSTVGHGDVP
jgi:hypothetical protein